MTDPGTVPKPCRALMPATFARELQGQAIHPPSGSLLSKLQGLSLQRRPFSIWPLLRQIQARPNARGSSVLQSWGHPAMAACSFSQRSTKGELRQSSSQPWAIPQCSARLSAATHTAVSSARQFEALETPAAKSPKPLSHKAQGSGVSRQSRPPQ